MSTNQAAITQYGESLNALATAEDQTEGGLAFQRVMRAAEALQRIVDFAGSELTSDEKSEIVSIGWRVREYCKQHGATTTSPSA